MATKYEARLLKTTRDLIERIDRRCPGALTRDPLTPRQLARMTPEQVDTRIAELDTALVELGGREGRLADLAHYVARDTSVRTFGKRPYWSMSDREAWARVLQMHEAGDETTNRQLAARPTASELVAERDAIHQVRGPLTARRGDLQREYFRRPWPRYFLVTSSAGHLHSSTQCGSCRRTTTFGWWVELSGRTEAEAIVELGKRADALCSRCFPAAPVASKRTNIRKTDVEQLSTGPVFTDASGALV